MASVTYRNQPAIQATHGNVPLAGTSHLYRVTKVLWPPSVETYLKTLLIGRTLHVCCGLSRLGDVRLDLDSAAEPDLLGDAPTLLATLPEDSCDTILCDPPYSGKFQWNHDLLKQLSRVASQRIVFQHWYLAANTTGLYKKAQEKFQLTELYAWAPKTYFGRAQLIQVYDRRPVLIGPSGEPDEERGELSDV